MGSEQDIDVGVYLAGLLFEYDAVALPGLGSLETRYRPAEVDRVQGKLFPPSKRLVFRPEAKGDDGRLAARIRDRYGLSQAQAEQRVAAFVERVRTAVREREIVVFPQVGRLYEDYQHQLQFIPDSTNFNPSTFGLPALNYQSGAPRTVIHRAELPARAQDVAPAAGARIRAWFRRYASLVGTALVLMVALAIFLLLPKSPEVPDAAPAPPRIPPERLNRPPSADEARGDGSVPLPDTPAPAGPELDTEASTIAPDQASAIIAIGLFVEDENIDRLVREIYQAGYEPYLEDRRENTLVGIQRAYADEADLQRTLDDVRDQFAPDAFVLRRRQPPPR